MTVVPGRTAVVLLGLIPLLTAGGYWTVLFALDDAPRGAEKRMSFSVVALGLLAIAVLAWRHGAGRWTPLWVLGGGGCGVLWFYVIALVLVNLADTSGGCLGASVYC